MPCFNPRALTHAQLADIVADVQAILWQESRMLPDDPRQYGQYWNPAKEWEQETVEEIADVLDANHRGRRADEAEQPGDSYLVVPQLPSRGFCTRIRPSRSVVGCPEAYHASFHPWTDLRTRCRSRSCGG